MARRRSKPRGKKINPTLYVFCEAVPRRDETEESYINLLKRDYRIPSIIIHAKTKGSDITARFINEYKKDRPTHPKDQIFLFYDLDVSGILDRLQKIGNSTLLVSNGCRTRMSGGDLLSKVNDFLPLLAFFCCSQVGYCLESIDCPALS